jgi:UDP-2,3-diacylglucosamine hydrolase
VIALEFLRPRRKGLPTSTSEVISLTAAQTPTNLAAQTPTDLVGETPTNLACEDAGTPAPLKILAISDCHYKYHASRAEDSQNAARLICFLRQSIGKYDVLALVGDIFDLWYDGKFTIVKQYFPLLRVLADIHDAGTRLIFISGNHDFWFGDFLPDYLGCEIYPDGYTLEADGVKIRFEHGDTRTVNDIRYQVYRKIIRLGLVKHLFSLLHPDFALSLGTLLSRSSRGRKENLTLRRRKTRGLKLYAQKLIDQHKADIVVMGHSHNPELISLAGGFYANCGDWIAHHTFIEIIAGKPALQQYIGEEVVESSGCGIPAGVEFLRPRRKGLPTSTSAVIIVTVGETPTGLASEDAGTPHPNTNIK